jgi:hypothetical protein
MADLPPSHALGMLRDFSEVRTEVHRLVQQIAPGHDTCHIDQAFTLIDEACQGRLPGYQSLQTPYHDQIHVMEVVLCGTRLLHGLHLAGQPVDRLTIDACIVGMLLHDSGYLMNDAEAQGSAGTGAQFTPVHVVRGVVFAETQLVSVLPQALLSATGNVILATDHRAIAELPEFSSPAESLAARVASTADLLGQMASREYLERLLLLYSEFQEGGIEFFTNVHDLLEKTGEFYRFMQVRLGGELGNLAPYLVLHFRQDQGVERNYYLESIQRNIDYLSRVVQEVPARRYAQLKRGGIVERALDTLVL